MITINEERFPPQIQHNWDNYFDSIVSRIKDDTLRMVTDEALKYASSHFKYGWSGHKGGDHKYGLYKHTKATCDVAILIMECSQDFLKIDSDIVFAGSVLHDIGKGFDNHPKTGAEYVRGIADRVGSNGKVKATIKVIERHMGIYGKDKPKSVEERIVHVADYIASRIY